MECKINKILLCLTFITIFTIIILSLTIISTAENNYNIEVVETDYEFLNTVGSENQKFNYYTIKIKLKNNGAAESDDITLTIWGEDEIYTRRNGTIKAGKTVEFTFGDVDAPLDNWMVEGTGEHIVNYEYHPTNTSKINDYNSGAGFFKITDGSLDEENTSNTPGFDILLFLLALNFIFIIVKKIKK